jgi:hypothetical protein
MPVLTSTALLIAAGTAAAGAAVSAAGAAQQGRAANKLAGFQARQLTQQAGQDRATAQRQAIGQRHEATLAGSRARALTAAGGGSMLDPSSVNIMGDIEGQGEYNALSALFNGEERARGQELQATSTLFSGKQAQMAGNISAGSEVLKGAGSLMSKYSPTGGAYTSSAKPWANPDLPRY